MKGILIAALVLFSVPLFSTTADAGWRRGYAYPVPYPVPYAVPYYGYEPYGYREYRYGYPYWAPNTGYGVAGPSYGYGRGYGRGYGYGPNGGYAYGPRGFAFGFGW